MWQPVTFHPVCEHVWCYCLSQHFFSPSTWSDTQHCWFVDALVMCQYAWKEWKQAFRRDTKQNAQERRNMVKFQSPFFTEIPVCVAFWSFLQKPPFNLPLVSCLVHQSACRCKLSSVKPCRGADTTGITAANKTCCFLLLPYEDGACINIFMILSLVSEAEPVKTASICGPGVNHQEVRWHLTSHTSLNKDHNSRRL